MGERAIYVMLRSDGKERRIGPFGTVRAANQYVQRITLDDFRGSETWEDIADD